MTGEWGQYIAETVVSKMEIPPPPPAYNMHSFSISRASRGKVVYGPPIIGVTRIMHRKKPELRHFLFNEAKDGNGNRL